MGSYSEALELVRKGFSIRMSDGKSPANLVVPASLDIVEEPADRLDDLWTYTMPEVPFTFDAVLADLRTHLLSQASDIRWIADDRAASAFLGVPVNEDGELGADAAAIDLDRFNIARITKAAYLSAFRPRSSAPLSDDDADELEQILGASLTRFGRRHYSPLEVEGTPLYRTLVAAYYRWQIADGCFLADDRLDQNAMTALTALTGMPASTIRNALSKDGISTVKGKLDYFALIRWLEQRRGFTPLREDERPASRSTWDQINTLRSQPTAEALTDIRSRYKLSGSALDAAETALLNRANSKEPATEAELRAYALAAGTLPDSFILGMHAVTLS